jgi:hypothetical protein
LLLAFFVIPQQAYGDFYILSILFIPVPLHTGIKNLSVNKIICLEVNKLGIRKLYLRIGSKTFTCEIIVHGVGARS